MEWTAFWVHSIDLIHEMDCGVLILGGLKRCANRSRYEGKDHMLAGLVYDAWFGIGF